jgi:hypothetical protein
VNWIAECDPDQDPAADVCTITHLTTTTEGTSKLLFVNAIQRSTRMPLMSGTYLNSINFEKNSPRKENFREHPSINVHQQPYCKRPDRYSNEPYKRDDFLSERKRDRGHLTPVLGNMYSEKVICDLH